MRLCVFAHYDSQDEVKPYVLHLLRALRQECDEITFVSTSTLPETEIEKTRDHCSRTMCKDNAGYDFGMWKYALERTDPECCDELALVNSSILGPLFPLHPIMQHMEAQDCDFWGMTDSKQVAWHLQSYFLVFRACVLRSQAFRQFWHAVLPYRNKDQVVRSYELGLTVFLQEHGFRAQPVRAVDSLPSPISLSRFRRKRFNPTHKRAGHLLARGFPFVKLELLRDNPEHIHLGPIFRAIQRSGYDMSLIPAGIASDRSRWRSQNTIWVP
jgi:lipopolysaccharide biosynthesis protein